MAFLYNTPQFQTPGVVPSAVAQQFQPSSMPPFNPAQFQPSQAPTQSNVQFQPPAVQFVPSNLPLQVSGPDAPSNYQTHVAATASNVNFNPVAQFQQQQPMTSAPQQIQIQPLPPMDLAALIPNFVASKFAGPVFYDDNLAGDFGYLSFFYPATVEGTTSGDKLLTAFGYLATKIAHITGQNQTRDAILALPHTGPEGDFTGANYVTSKTFELAQFLGAFMQQHRQDFLTLFFQSNLLKFAQHPKLLAKLTETGERILNYCIQGDRVNAIGFAVEQGTAMKPDSYGENVYGRIMMDVRGVLRTSGIPNWCVIKPKQVEVIVPAPLEAPKPIEVKEPEPIVIVQEPIPAISTDAPAVVQPPIVVIVEPSKPIEAPPAVEVEQAKPIEEVVEPKVEIPVEAEKKEPVVMDLADFMAANPPKVEEPKIEEPAPKVEEVVLTPLAPAPLETPVAPAFTPMVAVPSLPDFSA